MNLNKFKNPAQMLSRNNTAFNPEVKRPPKKAKKCAEGEAVNTVAITQCPNYVDRRFEPAPGFVGELTKQWRQLRGEA